MVKWNGNNFLKKLELKMNNEFIKCYEETIQSLKSKYYQLGKDQYHNARAMDEIRGAIETIEKYLLEDINDE